jgi:hypothetical protein
VGIKNDRLKYRPSSSSHLKIERIADRSMSENRFAHDSKQNVIGDVPQLGKVPKTFKKIEASFEPISVDEKNTNPEKMKNSRNIEYRSKQKSITAKQPIKRSELGKCQEKKTRRITSKIKFTKRIIGCQPPD